MWKSISAITGGRYLDGQVGQGLATVVRVHAACSAVWKQLLEGEPAQARQILRKLLEGRLVLRPRVDRTGRFYDWSATATYGRILTGVVRVTVMVPLG